LERLVQNLGFILPFLSSARLGFVFFFFLLKEKRNKKVQGRHESSVIRPSLASPSVAVCLFTFYPIV
jgi:hypothetical protein